MPDFLTRRNGTWHFARRVPIEFAHLDRRGVVRRSTKIRIASDRAAVRASRVAATMVSNNIGNHSPIAISSGSANPGLTRAACSKYFYHYSFELPSWQKAIHHYAQRR
jgi:hypothetical protein